MYYYYKQKSQLRQKLTTLFLIFLGVFFVWGSLHLPSPKKLFTASSKKIQALAEEKKGHEVFGFAPYWTLDKMQNVDFSVLTTLSYFGIPVGGDGNLDRGDVGYTSFESQQATDLFKRAHQHGTSVVLTLTQMDQGDIISLLNNPAGQQATIDQAVGLVKDRGIDGINVDFEYITDPGQDYRNKFTKFVADLTYRMHQEVPNSKVTVSVLASSVKEPKLYDIRYLSENSDGIFMMAYDFATTTADNAMPTAPLHGYQNGTYWYDVATAVNDFLTQMTPTKLILGVPWYAYNYAVSQPGVKAVTSAWSSGVSQTYSIATDNVPAQQQGWDNEGDVGWKAYFDSYSGVWRMVFLDDVRSLGMKYDFAKEKNLGGVGIWALGFDDGKHEMWSLLEDKFGTKFADSTIMDRQISQ